MKVHQIIATLGMVMSMGCTQIWGATLIEILTPTPDKITQGQQLYAGFCSACHGLSGKGDGVAGAYMNPKPRDFSKLEGWKNGTTISQLYQSLEEGLPKTGMPGFDTIAKHEKIAIIHYIRTFNPNYPHDSEQELADFDNKFSVSHQEKAAKVIPVDVAMQHIAQETTKLQDDVTTLVAKLAADDSAEGITVRRLVDNPQRFFSALKGLPDWTKNLNTFLTFMLANPTAIGLNSTQLNLSKKDWQLVFQYLTFQVAGSNIAATDNEAKNSAAAPTAIEPASIAKYLCTTCHKLDSAIPLLGPSLFAIGKTQTNAEIEASIMQPDAIIAKGFAPGIMSATLKATGFFEKITPAELKEMVDYLSSLKGQ